MKVNKGQYTGNYEGDWLDGQVEEWYSIDGSLVQSPVYGKGIVGQGGFTLEEVCERNGVTRDKGVLLMEEYRKYFSKVPDDNGNRNFPQNSKQYMDEGLHEQVEYGDGYSIVHGNQGKFNPTVDEFDGGCRQLPSPFSDYWLFRSSDSEDAIGVLFKWVQRSNRKYWMYVSPVLANGIQFNMRNDDGVTKFVSIGRVYSMALSDGKKHVYSNHKYGKLAIKNWVENDVEWFQNDKEVVYDKSCKLERDTA